MPRKKTLKSLSLEELIKEKDRAIAVLEELKKWSFATLIEVNDLIDKLKINIDSVDNRVGNSVDNSTLSITKRDMESINFSQYSPYNRQEPQEEGEGLEIRAIFSSDGNLSPGIRMLSIEESTKDYEAGI